MNWTLLNCNYFRVKCLWECYWESLSINSPFFPLFPWLTLSSRCALVSPSSHSQLLKRHLATSSKAAIQCTKEAEQKSKGYIYSTCLFAHRLQCARTKSFRHWALGILKTGRAESFLQKTGRRHKLNFGIKVLKNTSVVELRCRRWKIRKKLIDELSKNLNCLSRN